jgi:UDP-N-acetyl-D-glucosamine dehydrogenase
MQTAVSTAPALPSGATQLKEDAIARFKSRNARIGVIGLGYVGLPLALLFSEEGFPVTGFDIDNTKIDMLASSRSYICRIPETEIALARDRGFQATTDFACISKMDAIVICVPTPLTEYHEPDLSFVTDTVKSIAPFLQSGQ